MKDHELTAAPYSITLGGKEFRLSPLTDQDHGELDLWCQGRIIAMAKEAARSLPKEEQDDLIDRAFDQASGVSWATGKGQKIFSTIPGVVRLAWQMAKGNHKITLEEFKEYVTTAEDLDKITNAFTVLHTPPEDTNGKSAGNELKSRQKKKKSIAS